MKKRLKGPVWKKGMVSPPPVYVPPLELEANLSEEQKKWPVTELVISPIGTDAPPEVQERDPNPRPAPQPPAA